MSGTVLLTGANGSLAIPAVRYLLSKYPHYTAVLTVRNTSNTDQNTDRLWKVIAEFPDSKTSIRALDLASLSEVQTFASTLSTEITTAKLPPLTAIICNAYAWSISDGLKSTGDGYELSMAVNHISHFALVMRLLGNFAPGGGKITFLGSDAHYPGKANLERYPPVLPDDLEKLVKPDSDKEGEEVGRGFQRYGVSKIVVIMVMFELNRRLLQDPRLQKITAVAEDPGGLVDSRTWEGDRIPMFWKYAMIGVISPLLPVLRYAMPTLRYVDVAAEELIEVSVGEKYAGERGYFTLGEKGGNSLESEEEGVQKALWAKSLKWAGIQKEDIVLEGAFE